MKSITARSSTGLETEDKYRLLKLPAKRYLVRPERISQGYFRFEDQDLLTIVSEHGSCYLEWKHGKKVWRTAIPKWTKAILKNSRKREFRIRRSESSGRVFYFGAVKSEGRLTRKEWQVRLPKELAELLWPFTDGHRIYKTRHTIKLKFDRIIHLDVFEQRLQGLIIAEVECPTEASAKEYLAKGGPANMLGTCVLVTYDSMHRHRKLMDATEPPALPLLFSRKDKAVLSL